MSTPDDAAAGPSRVTQEERPDPDPDAEQEQEPSAAAVPPKQQPQLKRWLVLSAIPTVQDPIPATYFPSTDERVRFLLPGADLALHNHPAPRASHLMLSKRIAPDFHRFDIYPYIHAADADACVLFRATERPGADSHAFFVGDVLTRVVRRIPPVPGYMLRPSRGVGLIADPRRRGSYLVGQLEPSVPILTRYTTLLCYSTATDRWNPKPLATAPEQERRWGAHGVLAHQGLLWWVDVAYGLLVCDPFLDRPHLRLVPLPPGYELQGDVVHRHLIDDRRFVRLSEDKLRYVEIRGDGGRLDDDNLQAAAVLDTPTLRMWTLADPDALHPWELEYEVPLTEVWAHDTYIAADLPPNVVPKLGLVHPYNHSVLCLFQGASLFALDVRTRRVLACQECRIHNDPELSFQSSPYVHAWALLPHEILGHYPPSATEAQWNLQMKESVESWLVHLEPGRAPSDEEQWSGTGMVGLPVDSAAPSDSPWVLIDASCRLSPSEPTLVQLPEDLVFFEVILRIPPDDPAPLFRFQAVSRAWRDRLADDGEFRARYRNYHAAPPVLGYMYNDTEGGVISARFVPVTSFSPCVPGDDGEDNCVLDCRHGLVLLHKYSYDWFNSYSYIIVWDPMTNEEYRVPLPTSTFDSDYNWTASVLCSAPDCSHLQCHGAGGHFKVAFIGVNPEESLLSAYIFSSETGCWTEATTAHFQVDDNDEDPPRMKPSILIAENLIYVLTSGQRIVEYDLSSLQISVSDQPPATLGALHNQFCFYKPSECGSLGLAIMGENMEVHLTQRNAPLNTTASWVELDKQPLSLGTSLAGFGENPSLLLFSRPINANEKEDTVLFLEPYRYRELPNAVLTTVRDLIPYSAFCTPGPAEADGVDVA